MRLAKMIALTLAPDLHEVARRVKATEHRLGQVQTLLDAALVTAGDARASAYTEEARTDVVEARAVLIEVYADLTGRGPEKILPNPG